MVELAMRRREIGRDGANHHEKQGLRELRMWVNLPSPIWQVQVPIRCVITLIRGLSNPIRQVVPIISHICSYPTHYSHPHSTSPSFSFTTLPLLQNTKLRHGSLFLHAVMGGVRRRWYWKLLCDIVNKTTRRSKFVSRKSRQDKGRSWSKVVTCFAIQENE